MSVPLVFICAPYAGKDEAECRRNVRRALLVARLAIEEGWLPLCPHDVALHGFGWELRGSPLTPGRSAGMAYAVGLLHVVQASGGEMWVIDDPTSSGVWVEVAEWRIIDPAEQHVVSLPWFRWQDWLASRGLVASGVDL